MTWRLQLSTPSMATLPGATTPVPSAAQVFHVLTHPRRSLPSADDAAALAGAVRQHVLHRGQLPCIRPAKSH